MTSVEMSQQQKIAAALARAGTSHSTAWLSGSTGVAVAATEPDVEQETTRVPELQSAQFAPTAKSSNTNQLLIWCGLALTVLSSYLLVIFH